MRRIIFLYFFTELILGISTGFGQVPFSQVNQIPLVLNPSQAGAKSMKRIALGCNRYASDPVKNSNVYVSYDQLIEPIGSGFGIYFLHQDLKGKNYPYQDYYLDKSSASSIGIALAPKYNLHGKKSNEEIKYTFSPSLSVEYSVLKNVLHSCESWRIGSFLYNTDNPQGIPTAVDSTRTFTSSNHTKVLKIGAGFQLNNDKFIILYKVCNEREKNIERASILSESIATHQQSVNTLSLDQRLFSLTHLLSIGRTFSLNRERLSFTPIAGIGYRHYLNLPSTQNERNYYRYYYSASLLSKQSGVNYAHLSLNFRYQKFLFGGAYTYSPFGSYYGGTAGIQTDSLRLMTTWSFSSSFLFSEITASLQF